MPTAASVVVSPITIGLVLLWTVMDVSVGVADAVGIVGAGVVVVGVGVVGEESPPPHDATNNNAITMPRTRKLHRTEIMSLGSRSLPWERRTCEASQESGLP